MNFFLKNKPGKKNPALAKPQLSTSVVSEEGKVFLTDEPVKGVNLSLDRIVSIIPVYIESGHYLIGLSENGNSYALNPINRVWEPQLPSPIQADYFGNSIQL